MFQFQGRDVRTQMFRLFMQEFGQSIIYCTLSENEMKQLVPKAIG